MSWAPWSGWIPCSSAGGTAMPPSDGPLWDFLSSAEIVDHLDRVFSWLLLGGLSCRHNPWDTMKSFHSEAQLLARKISFLLCNTAKLDLASALKEQRSVSHSNCTNILNCMRVSTRYIPEYRKEPSTNCFSSVTCQSSNLPCWGQRTPTRDTRALLKSTRPQKKKKRKCNNRKGPWCRGSTKQENKNPHTNLKSLANTANVACSNQYPGKDTHSQLFFWTHAALIITIVAVIALSCHG